MFQRFLSISAMGFACVVMQGCGDDEPLKSCEDYYGEASENDNQDVDELEGAEIDADYACDIYLKVRDACLDDDLAQIYSDLGDDYQRRYDIYCQKVAANIASDSKKLETNV